MKASNANKVVSVLLSVAMCPMMVPSAAFAADDDAALDASSPIEQAQSADQAEASGTSASSSDTVAPQSESADASTGEEAAPAATATINGHSTLEEAVQNATVDAQGVITYEVTGKVNVDSTGWVQVRPTAATNAKVVKFVGKSADAEICITQGAAILADQESSALSVEFSNLTLSKLNPKWAQDFGHSTNYFTTWLRNTDAASNCVTYTNCEFPNGVCNNQYGKTVFDNCTFSNATSGLYNMWVYGGNVEVKGGSFTGVRGVKVYTEGTATVAPKVDITGASFAGVSEKAAIVVSKPAAVTLSNVSATNCANGLIQKDVDGSSEVTLDANGTGIGGSFNITANTGSDVTKAEFNLNSGALTTEVSSDFLADGFTLNKNSDGTFGVAEAAPAAVAEVAGKSYPSLQAAIDAASRNATVKLLADTYENVTISTYEIVLDLNGYTLNGGTVKGRPALTIDNTRVTVQDSSEAQTGTIMREDTAENSSVSSHYVIDVQGKYGYLLFNGGTVKNNSGAGGTKGASLVRVGNDSYRDANPTLTIKGGTFTQDNFIAIKVDFGTLWVSGGTVNSKNSYAIENWRTANIKDSAVVNGNVSSWTYSGGISSKLTISGGTVNGNVESVTYDGAEGKTAKVSITGGTVNGTLSASQYNSTETNDPTKATIEVTGGTFSTNPSRYVVENSAVTKNADDTYGVAKAYLAQVGETSYYTMKEAFDAQTANGEAITLLRDYTTSSIFNSGSTARVVNLNGHTWTCTGTDANSAAFEINNPNASLTVKNGKVVSSQLIGLIPSAMGGTITYDNSTLTFENVEASTTATSGIETNGNNTNDTVVLKDSTLNVPNGFGIYFPSSGTLTINNSKINAKTMGAQVCSGNLNVTAGSEITVSGDPVEKTEGDGAIQDGAAISIVNRAGYKGLGQIAIAGGTFKAKGNNAALKAYTWDSATKQELAFDNSAKTVAVSGGTFSSAVASGLCAEGYAPVANADGTYSVGVPVAQIGGTVYTSLQAAIDAAQDGETVQLLSDAVVDDTVIVKDKGAITLDLNGKTISNTKEIWNDKTGHWSLISVRGNSDLTITGNGAIDALENDSYAIDLYDAASKCTIENGAFTGNISAVYIMEGALTINDGTFDIKQLSSGQDGRRFTINCYDSSYKNGTAQVSINGGTFNGFDPANNLAEGTGTAFTAPGYTTVANADGTYSVAAGVAQVAGKAFTSLQAAIDAAQDGETVTLLTDATEDATIAAGKNITLDLGDKTLTNTNAGKATLTIAKDATATVKNGNVIGGTSFYTIQNNGTATLEDVTATAGNIGSSMIDNWGTLTITSGTYTSGLNVVKSEEGSKLTITGGTFTLDYAPSSGYTAVILVYGDTTISGGEFVQTATPKWGYPQVVMTGVVEGYTSITRVTGGHFTNKKSGNNIFHGFTPATSANFEVSGGTYNKSVSDGFLADGFTCVKNSDGTYGVVTAIAQVGSSKYTSLQAAITAAGKGKTVQLLNDTTENVTIAATKQITLDLNGHTLNGGTDNANAAILNKGNVTITDASADETGTIKRDDQGIEGETSYYVIRNIGTMVIDQAIVENNSGYPKANSSGSMVGSSLICNGDDDSQASLTINGGTFTQLNFLVVKNGSNGTLTVNGGTLTSNHSAVQNWNKAQILGGSLKGQIWTDAWVEGAIGETVIGGDAQFSGEIVVDITGTVPPTLKIEGGSLDITSWNVTSAAAEAGATIAVSGGTFTAPVPEDYCAAGYVPATNADDTYGVAVGKFTVQVTSRTTTSDSPVANVSGGGSDITYADGTTVTASAISGYNFVGWFVNDYSGTPYSTDLTCTVKPTDNCTMIAVYEPVSGGKFWLTVTASEFTVNGGAVQDSYLYEQYAIGASVTVNFTGTENFLYWVNASNKVVSTDKSYTFTMGSETALKAVYGKARQNQATVVFISHSDQIISSKAYTTSDTIQFPVPPIKMGCTFTGWSMTESEIREAMANNNGIIQVRALYTEPSVDCKVTVIYPDGTSNEVVNTKVGQLVNVTAKDIEGKTFSYWTDNDGNVLGYTKTLKLAPSGDMTVNAIYSDGATEAKPVISMTAVDANAGNGYYLISFTATRAVPEGYELVKQGVLYSIDSRCAGDAGKDYLKLTADGTVPEGVYEYSGGNNDPNGVTRFNGKVRTADTTLYGRGYMILKNSAGEVLYVYSDTILSGSYNSLKK